MRAIVITRYGGPEVLQVEAVEMPVPVGDQVRVRVHAAGLNRADLLQRQGRYPAPAAAPAMIPGLEIAGEVDALGPHVEGLRVGDRVFGIVSGGAYAEYVVTTEDLLARIPPNLDYAHAAAVPEVFMTAYDALFLQARLAPGERVLIHAAGSGVGTAAVQLARLAGATVYGTARSAAKRPRLEELGVHAVLAPEEVLTRLHGSDGHGNVEVVIDFVGGPYLAMNLQVLVKRGRLVIVGLLGGAEAKIDLGQLLSKRLRLIGTVLRSRPRGEKAALTAMFSEHVVPLLATGRLRPILDRVFELDQAAEAHAYMETNASFGKIILQIDHGS